MKFSANLGFLWTELSLPDAIYAAAAAGFDAVECHWPYDQDAAEVSQALQATGLSMLGLNTRRGSVDQGENGLSALPDRQADARAAIDEATAYAIKIRAKNIHVMAGFASGDQAHQIFIDNLRYATRQAQQHGITILIEPLNHYDAPGYFLNNTSQATAIISEVGAPNLKLMFDCYHIQLMEGDLTNKLSELLSIIGHIQIAAVPSRQEPDRGEIDYSYIFKHLSHIGYDQPVGVEYKPKTKTDENLQWMKKFSSL